MGVLVGASVGVAACVVVADGVIPAVEMAVAVVYAEAVQMKLTVGVLELLEDVVGPAVGDSITELDGDTVAAGENEAVVDAGALGDVVALGEAVAAGESDPPNGARTGFAIGFF